MSWRSRLPLLGLLVAAWLLLQGEASAGNVLAGALVAGTAVALFPLRPSTASHRVDPVGVVRLAAFVARSLVVSTWRVALAVVRPTPARLRAGIVAVRLPHPSPLVVTLVGNAISVTPGTLTVSAHDDGLLHVHVLGLGDPDEFRDSVLDLDRRVRAAFSPVVGSATGTPDGAGGSTGGPARDGGRR